MRYLLQFMLVLSLAACQNPRVEMLEAEKAGLILLYEKEAEMTQTLEERALQEAKRAMEMARYAPKRRFKRPHIKNVNQGSSRSIS